MPLTWYSVVINNPTAEDEAALARVRKNGYAVEGQLEKGKNGTPHYQLAVGTHDSWEQVRTALPRANVQEAVDSVALRRYVVKTETRLVDFSLPKPTKCLPDKLNNIGFYDLLFQQIYESCGTISKTKQAVEADALLTTYDRGVCGVMACASTADSALTFATRAIRPDVRAIYKRYRSSMLEMWSPSENINLPMVKDADEDEGSEQAAGVLGGEHEDDEGVSEGSEDTDGEDDSDSQQDTEASNSESD